MVIRHLTVEKRAKTMPDITVETTRVQLTNVRIFYAKLQWS